MRVSILRQDLCWTWKLPARRADSGRSSATCRRRRKPRASTAARSLEETRSSAPSPEAQTRSRQTGAIYHLQQRGCASQGDRWRRHRIGRRLHRPGYLHGEGRKMVRRRREHTKTVRKNREHRNRSRGRIDTGHTNKGRTDRHSRTKGSRDIRNSRSRSPANRTKATPGRNRRRDIRILDPNLDPNPGPSRPSPCRSRLEIHPILRGIRHRTRRESRRPRGIRGPHGARRRQTRRESCPRHGRPRRDPERRGKPPARMPKTGRC